MAEAELSASVTAAPWRGGVIDRAFARLERLPGAGIPWVIAGVVVLELVAQAASWVAGETPFGAVRQELLFPVPFLAFFVLLIVVLDGVARSAFDDFQISLDQPADVVARLRDDLTSIPDVAGFLTAVAWGAFVALAGTDGSPSVEPPVTGVVLAALWFLTNGALAWLILHTLRQLRQVGRLQAMVAKVNLLDPGPINAFSRLTAATAGGILTIGVLFAVVDADAATTDPSTFGFGIEIAIALIAIAFFVLPLRGMHGRLAAEKGRLLGDVNDRLRLVLGRIHGMVDADDLARAGELQATQSALLAERDLYLHLSTWPWSTGTFRGLLSAVMLPIFIGVILRLATHVI